MRLIHETRRNRNDHLYGACCASARKRREQKHQRRRRRSRTGKRNDVGEECEQNRAPVFENIDQRHQENKARGVPQRGCHCNERGGAQRKAEGRSNQIDERLRRIERQHDHAHRCCKQPLKTRRHRGGRRGDPKRPASHDIRVGHLFSQMGFIRSAAAAPVGAI